MNERNHEKSGDGGVLLVGILDPNVNADASPGPWVWAGVDHDDGYSARLYDTTSLFRDVARVGEGMDAIESALLLKCKCRESDGKCGSMSGSHWANNVDSIQLAHFTTLAKARSHPSKNDI
ncbi:hypothetical protein F52700_13365 [Fusarium sp. NRRL 52700]|nr:hypothetical protein F52700_13365 [Fusarium sp. NRRL 52700]